MQKTKKFGNVFVLLGVLLLAMTFSFPLDAAAKSKVVEIEGMSYNVKASMGDNLKLLIGKKVYVSLDSGQTLAGTIKSVGNHLIHLEKIERKEYFDALIRIKNIIAIDVRFREIQR